MSFEKAINSLQSQVATLSFIERAEGRAMRFKEIRDGKLLTVPKVYIGNGEYENVLPNDNYFGFAFFITTSEERILDPADFKERDCALLIWFDLSRAIVDDVISLDNFKQQVIKILDENAFVNMVTSYKDEDIEDIFSEFDIPGDIYSAMNPFSAMRFEFKLSYSEPCC